MSLLHISGLKDYLNYTQSHPHEFFTLQQQFLISVSSFFRDGESFAVMPHEKAVQIIIEGKGSHFDPDMVDAFIELQEEFKKNRCKLGRYRCRYGEKNRVHGQSNL